MTSSVTVRLDGVSKRFRRYRSRHNSLKAVIIHRTRGKYDDFWALDDVTFEINAGETFGLVGHNGSGKSTLLKCIAGILQPDRGSLWTEGRISSLLELGSGFHPELSGRENVYLNGTFFGYSRREITARFDDIVDFSGLHEFIDEPVKTYSSGMYARLGFAVATHVDPEILLVDEVLAVGDEEFQRRCIERIVTFRREGRTIVFVSHALGSVRMLCDRAVWLDHGRMRGLGDPGELVDQYVDEATAQPSRPGENASDGSWLSAEVLDRTGTPVSNITSGDPVRLRVKWDAPRPLAAPVIGLAMYRHDGVLIYATDTKIGGMDLSIDRGPASLTFMIPRFPVFPGTFNVEVAIAEEWGERPLVARRPGVSFSVVGSVDHGSIGVFDPDGRWEAEGQSLVVHERVARA